MKWASRATTEREMSKNDAVCVTWLRGARGSGRIDDASGTPHATYEAVRMT